MAADKTSFEDLGPNSGLIEEMYRRYVENPGSVAETWREFFADYKPLGATDGNGASARRACRGPAPVAPPVATPAPAAVGSPAPDDAPEPLRGAAARTVVNMEASLAVPTATSVRTVPARLLEVNRQILNNQLARSGGGKVSFTHLIAFAVVRAVERMPAVNAGFALLDGKPAVVHHEHMNLGLAVDVKKSDDSRTLLVPNIKAADTLDFAGFFRAYEELIRKVRTNKLSPDDFAGTTGTITNPGMIGTVHSVPRLMPGQGFIIGVGSIGYPAEYEGADPQLLARIGVGKVITLTNTYDHRIIGGAESGEFLRWIHHLLLGEDGFYDDVFQSLAVPYEPARWSTDTGALDDDVVKAEKVVHVHQLINMYRVRGHLIANLDPLGRREPRTHPELDIRHYGLTIWDLEREFPVGSLGVGTIEERVLPLRDILGIVRDAYARSIGVEYMHIQEPDQKDWIQRHVEGAAPEVSAEDQRRVLERLNAAEAFEAFLQRKYLGQKRFSLEGAESLIPMLDALLNAAADDGVDEAVLGMAHRGRLNVLVNTVGKGYGQIFREFEGALDPASVQGSGDVKYHVGAIGKHLAPSGAQLTITMASNPSHLEAVDPVVEGMARAATDAINDAEGKTVLPVLVHGDAAFAGQGVVAETFNLSEVPGYEVGGTVHVVVNNQLGFTTSPSQGRSSVYATDVAKMVQAPIFHVNGDDPEACVRVIRLAYEFRREFHKDVVVDMVCYRRFGHNEADEPAFTQPAMYALIGERRSIRKLYTEQLVNRGDLSLEEAEAALGNFRSRMDDAFEEVQRVQVEPPAAPGTRAHRSGRGSGHLGRDRRAARNAGAHRRRSDHLTRRLPHAPEARASARGPPRRVRGRGDRLGPRRGVRARFDGARRDTRAPLRSGHAAGHVQPAPRGDRRRRERDRVHSARRPRPRPGAVHALRLGALRVRRPRFRVRVLGVGADHVRRLGGPVRRLRERCADHRRPVHRRRGRQVGSVELADDAAPPRLRRSGPGTLQRPARALPRAVRRRQHAGRLPEHVGAVLPRAAPPGARAAAQAARVLHSEAVPAHGAHPLARRGVHPRRIRERPRRPF